MDEQLLNLMALLGQSDADVRSATCVEILEQGSASVVLLQGILSGDDFELALNVVRDLSKIDHPQLLDLMAVASRSPNPIVAEIAVNSMEKHGQQAIPHLLKTLPVCHILVKLKIVAALERLGSTRAVPLLMEMLDETEASTMRYTIIQALGAIGDPVALPLIQSYAQDENHHVRERVAIAVGRLTNTTSESGNGSTER